MNYRLVSKLLGSLLLLLSGAMGACLVFAWLDHERQPGLDAVESLVVAVILTSGAGLVLRRLGRGAGVDLLRKEAVAVVGLGWVVAALFGSLPYMLCEPRLGPLAALFESVSGFTTTGATVMEDITAFPKAILLWRALTQWLGGLGILVLFVALLASVGVGSKALFRHESSARSGGGVRARIQDVAARLWQIYAGLSLICCLGLMALGMDLFEAACHTMAALSTGGFSTRNESIAAFGSAGIELWLVLFMILGGISFMLYAWLLRGRWDRWRGEEETKVYLAILAGATVLLAVNLAVSGWAGNPWQNLRESLFQVVAIMTTTGFTTADFDRWPVLCRAVLLVLMAVGGCAGSTAGGLKVSRCVLLWKIVRQQVTLSYRPNQVFTLRLNGEKVEEGVTLQTVFLVALAAITVVLGTLGVSLMEPALNLESSLSAVLATLFNIGPGLGAVGVTQHYGHLGGGTQLLLSGLMLLGRLEFFVVLALFAPSLWRRY